MMLEKIGEPAMLEQMAEEASELCKAALKYARVLRHKNPTPVTAEEAKKKLIEEYTDVFTCAQELHISPKYELISEKQKRFEERWEKMKQEQEGENTAVLPKEMKEENTVVLLEDKNGFPVFDDEPEATITNIAGKREEKGMPTFSYSEGNEPE